MLKGYERSAIVLLRKSGHSICRIRQITGHDRKSIRNILLEAASANAPVPDTKRRAPTDYAWLSTKPGDPVQAKRGRRSLLEPFSQHLATSLCKRPVSAAVLLTELRQLGYRGSKRPLQRFLRVQRTRLLTTKEQGHEWMRLMLQGAVDRQQAIIAMNNNLSAADVDLLLKYVVTKPLKLRRLTATT